MEEVKKQLNIFELLNQQVKPVWQKVKKLFYVPIITLVLLGGLGYYFEAQKPSYFNATLTYLLEDEIVNDGSKAAGSGLLLAALQGQSPSSNKTIMVDLSLSNKLVEQTLLRTVKIDNKDVLLVNYYIDKFGYSGSFKNKPAYEKGYKIGSDESRDYMLRNFSTVIKLSLKSKVMESGLLIMDYTCEDELFTKLFLENHLRTISDFYILKKLERSQNLANFAKKRRDSLLMVLQGKAYSAASISDNLFGSVKKTSRVPEMQASRDAAIASTMYTESVIAYTTAVLDLERKKPFITEVDDVRLPLNAARPKPIMKGIIFGILGLVLGVAGIVGWALGSDMLKKQKLEYHILHGN